MNTHDHDPRETAVWIPGSLMLIREEPRHGLAAEEALMLRALDQVQANRRRRARPLARLRLIAARRLGVASLTD